MKKSERLTQETYDKWLSGWIKKDILPEPELVPKITPLEKPTENLEGFILYNPFNNQFFFRVYKQDKSFTDYDIKTEEIHVKILGNSLSLYEENDQNKLGWATNVLKPQPGQLVVRVENEKQTTGSYDQNLHFKEKI